MKTSQLFIIFNNHPPQNTPITIHHTPLCNNRFQMPSIAVEHGKRGITFYMLILFFEIFTVR